MELKVDPIDLSTRVQLRENWIDPLSLNRVRNELHSYHKDHKKRESLHSKKRHDQVDHIENHYLEVCSSMDVEVIECSIEHDRILSRSYHGTSTFTKRHVFIIHDIKKERPD